MLYYVFMLELHCWNVLECFYFG